MNSIGLRFSLLFGLMFPICLCASSFILPLEVSDFRNTFSAYGVVEPAGENYVSVPRTYRGKIEWIIDEGSRVKEGDVLVRLETKEIQKELDSLLRKQEIKKIGRDLVIFREKESVNLKITELDDKRDTINKELFKLKHLKAPPLAERVKQEELSIDSAANEIKFLQEQFRAQKTLKNRGFLSQMEYEKIGFRLTKNRLVNEKGAINLALLKKPDNTLQIEKSGLEYENSNIDLTLLEKQLANSEKMKSLRINKEELSLQKIQSEVSKEQEKLQQTELTAPKNGLVFFVKSWRGSPKKGQQVWRGMRLVKVVDPTKIKIKVKVDEKDIEQVKSKQNCWIRFTSLPNKKFKGVVAQIGKLARPKDKRNPKGPRFFAVDVNIVDKLGKSGGSVGLNTSSRVEFLGDRHKGVVKIPMDAVFSDKQGSTTFHYFYTQPSKKRRTYLDFSKVLFTSENYYILKPEDTGNAKQIYLAP